MSPRLLLTALFFLLTSCRNWPSPSSAKAFGDFFTYQDEAQVVSTDVEKVLKTQDETLWAQWTQEKPILLNDAFSGKEALYAPQTLEMLKKAANEKAANAKAFSHLRIYLTGENLAHQMSEQNQALSTVEATTTFEANEQTYALRDFQRLLSQEKSAYRRKAIYLGAASAFSSWREASLRHQARLQEVLTSLGYASTAQWAFELRETSAQEMRGLSEEVLRQTEALYSSILESISQKELNMPPSRLTRADLPRLFRSNDTEALFPAQKQWAMVERTLAPMGLNLTTHGQFKVDISDVPSRIPGAFTVPLSVPQDVRLSFRAESGARAQGHVLHEVAHALKYGFTSPMRFELARLGNVTLSEVYAYLFEDLLLDAAWLETVAGLSKDAIEPYLKTVTAQRVYRVRLLAAQLLFQLSVWDGGENETRLHQQLFMNMKVLRLPVDDERIIFDLDETLSSADELRARILASQLKRFLKQRFGASFWTNPECGQFLKSLWAHGNALPLIELTRQFGAESFNVGVFRDDMAAWVLPAATPPADASWTPKPFGTPQQVVGAGADGGTP